MTNGSQAIWAAAPIAASGEARALRDNSPMPDDSLESRNFRLRKHADYQRVYKESRKHFSPSMTYFFSRRPTEPGPGGEAFPVSRVGLTAGKILGKAVDRNRIKRRMREAVRANLSCLPQSVDLVLHPRKSVIDMEFRKLRVEVSRIFSSVSSQLDALEPGSEAAKTLGAQAPKKQGASR